MPPTLRWGFYFALALGFMALVAAAIAICVYTGVPIRFVWLALTMWTVGLCVWVIRQRRENLGRPSFWIVLVVLLAMHVLVFGTVLQRYPDFRLAWFGPVILIEIVVW